MELITIILSGLLTALSSSGVIVDQVVANNIRSQVKNIDKLEVRIDNTPSHQILQGRIDRIRVASRGLEIIKDIKINTLELETDPIHLDLETLQQKDKNAWRKSLHQPLQAAIRLVMTEADINRALQSQEFNSRLQRMINQTMVNDEDTEESRYQILNPQIDFLGDNRLQLKMQLRSPAVDDETSKPLDITMETGFNLISGRTLQLVEPTVTVNGRKIARNFLKGFIENLNEQLDLRKLEKEGITVRILQSNLTADDMNLVVFVRLEGIKTLTKS
jgi:hypothetical protein